MTRAPGRLATGRQTLAALNVLVLTFVVGATLTLNTHADGLATVTVWLDRMGGFLALAANIILWLRQASRDAADLWVQILALAVLGAAITFVTSAMLNTTTAGPDAIGGILLGWGGLGTAFVIQAIGLALRLRTRSGASIARATEQTPT